MKNIDIPKKFPIPFAKNAGGSFIRSIPENSQIGIQAGAASLNDGFVPDNFTQIAAGGVPPFGQDINGILFESTSWDRWFSAGAPIYYDTDFASAIGGYPLGAILQSDIVIGAQWVSLVDDNLTDPDDVLTSANWKRVGNPVGTPLASFSTVANPGFALGNGLTIGNANSNATSRANADTIFLYNLIWFRFSNSQCPIFTSAGASTTRGANPAADFAANKALSTPPMQASGLLGVDTMGGGSTSFLSGVPVVTGNTTTPGSIVGETRHALSANENGPHAHANALHDPGHAHGVSNATLGGNSHADLRAESGGPDSPTGARAIIINSNTTGMTITNASSGSGAPHNTVDRNMLVYWNLVL